MALPPTSVHVIVWCGDTPVVHRPLDDRCERHKHTSARRAWSARWPASPSKAASKLSHEARRSSEEGVGSHESPRPNYESPRFVMV